MPRLNRKSELFAHISEVGVFRDTSGGLSSTAQGALPAVETLNTLEVAGAGAAAGDWFRVRANDNYPEINQVSSVAGVGPFTITPKYRWHRAIAVGDPVVEQTQTPLGHIAKEGVKVAFTFGREAVDSATRRLRTAWLLGYAKVQVDFSVLGFNLENVMAALGMLDTSANITGAGTVNDTTRAFVNGAAIKEQNDLSWYVNGTRKDGRTLIMQAWGCEVDYSKIQKALARGRAAMIPFSLVPTHGVRFIEID